MADYNPNSPQILGQEWCPIREETIEPTSVATAAEYGVAFPLDAAKMVQEARAYIRDWTDPGSSTNQNIGINIYPRGSEALSGPIKRLVIPVNNASSTGFSSPYTNQFLVNSMLSPDDGLTFNFDVNTSMAANEFVDLYFATNAYSNELTGKRILGVNFLYAMGGPLDAILQDFGDNGGFFNFTFKFGQAFTINFSTIGKILQVLNTNFNTPDVYSDLTGDFSGVVVSNPPIGRAMLGNVNPYWNGNTNTDLEVLPWTYTDLQRFEQTSSTRYSIRATMKNPGGTSQNGYLWIMSYAALEVIYCEETRVAVGGVGTNTVLSNPVGPGLTANRVPLRNLSRVINPVLPADDYVISLYRPTVPESYDNSTTLVKSPSLSYAALRELYAVPSIDAMRIDIPFPTDPTIVGKTFEAQDTHIIPQLTLHATGGTVLTQVHPFGNQAKAPVYGSIFAAQKIQDSVVGGSASYPWIRYYARRFGNTSIPLSVASAEVAGSTASITPTEFDALPEIVDGWKEVTLSLSSPATMGAVAGEPNWVWTAAGESAGNRWEVLGAWAPAVSAVPGSLLTLANSQLGAATYDGTTSSLMWLQFNNAQVSADNAADATLLFSQYPPSVSGFAVTALNQTLTTTTPNCPVNPACVPSAMAYNRLSWTLRRATAVDTFARTAVSGWGNAETGQAYTVSGSAGLYGVNGSYGFHTHMAGATSTTQSTLDVTSPDVDERVSFLVDTTDTANALTVSLLGRRTDDSNYYRATFTANTTQTIQFSVNKVVAGVSTDLVVINPYQNLYHSPLTWFTMRLRVSGTKIQAKLWPTNVDEPEAWSISTTDTSLASGNTVGVQSVDSSAAGSFTVYFDDFLVSPPSFGGLEIQRFDPVDGAFSTIMLATNPATTGFSDYEARVGQTSVYRMRERNTYDFVGQWNTPISGIISSPGVTGGSIALTLFTSNYVQDGSRNLAYSAEWENQPEETFTWPEGRDVTFQKMYDKDFPTAFHGLERGGEQFSRTILVNAAGIPPVATENGFENLRDMAWDSLPYVCVRDELGNRWYAAVLVPEGSRKRMVAAGHLNVASVGVVETTSTPYEVDP